MKLRSKKIVLLLINLVTGLFVAYICLLSVRETEIKNTQDNIVCNVIELRNMKPSYRQHPRATVIYCNKKYYVDVNTKESLQIGENDSLFYYDEVLDRVFFCNSNIKRGLYVSIAIFILFLLLWFKPEWL